MKNNTLHWYHPLHSFQPALKYHLHNNISEQQGASGNKGNIRFTCQQSHYPASCAKQRALQPNLAKFFSCPKRPLMPNI